MPARSVCCESFLRGYLKDFLMAQSLENTGNICIRLGVRRRRPPVSVYTKICHFAYFLWQNLHSNFVETSRLMPPKFFRLGENKDGREDLAPPARFKQLALNGFALLIKGAKPRGLIPSKAAYASPWLWPPPDPKGSPKLPRGARSRGR